MMMALLALSGIVVRIGFGEGSKEEAWNGQGHGSYGNRWSPQSSHGQSSHRYTHHHSRQHSSAGVHGKLSHHIDRLGKKVSVVSFSDVLGKVDKWDLVQVLLVLAQERKDIGDAMISQYQVVGGRPIGIEKWSAFWPEGDEVGRYGCLELATFLDNL